MRRLLLIGLILPLLLQGVRAQSAGQQLFDQGNAALDASDYPAAIQAYQDLIAKYPSESFIPAARFALGLAQLSGGQPADALATFAKLSDPQVPADIKENALYYSGQAAFSLAAIQKKEAQKEAFQKAIDFFTRYLSGSPAGTLAESALFSRSQAAFYQGAYDVAQKDLAQLLADFPQSKSRSDYLFWSGRGYAAQAEAVAEKDRAQALALGKQADAVFAELAAMPTAVLTANDAAMEAANLRLALAENDADYEKALADYRQVLSRDQLVPLQEKVLAGLAKEIGQAALAHDKAAYQALQERQQRQKARLAALKAEGDPAVEALLHEAEALNRLKRYDEARLVVNHAQPFAVDGDDRLRASYLRILTYALQGATGEADARLKQHLLDFPADPNAQNLRYLIAEQLRAQKDYPGAEAQYRRSLADFPAGRFADASAVALGAVLAAQQKQEEAAQVLSDFLKRKPDAANAPEARHNLGLALLAQKKYEEAAAEFQAVAADPKAGAFRANASLQAGFALLGAKKTDEALAALEKTIADFPGTEQAAGALFYQGVALEGKGDAAGALASYARVTQEYPKQAVAPMAGDRIVRLYQSQNKTDEMLAAARQLEADFPDSPQAAAAALAVGQTLEKRRDYDAAGAQYTLAARQDAAAPLALARAAAMWTAAGRALGSYTALTPEEKQEWQARMEKGSQAAAAALARFPAARETGVALEEEVRLAALKVDAGLLTPDQAAASFADREAAAAPAAQGRLELARIAVIYLRGKRGETLALYQKTAQANPSLAWNPEDLERYGGELLAAKQYDEATRTFTRLREQFPKEPRAQAGALYGLGAVQLASGHAAEADGFFNELEKGYAWSDKIWEAKLGRGQAAEDRGETAQARTFYQQVVMSPASSTESKARALLGFARSLETEGKLVENPKDKNEANAANNYLKIDALFDAAKEVAAEGLWRAGQVFEKANQPEKAKSAYQDLVRKYHESAHADDASRRLKALGA